MEMGRVISIKRILLRQGIVPALLCLSFLAGCSQQPEEKPVDYFELVRPEFTGQLAYETTDFVEDYWRVVGNTGFNKTIHLIADSLKEHLEYNIKKISDTEGEITLAWEKVKVVIPFKVK